jgi:hypothetical protein
MLEVDPGFGVWEEMRVADYREGKGTGWLDWSMLLALWEIWGMA